MVKAILYGASGGLAEALALRLLNDGWQLDLITRVTREYKVKQTFADFIASGRVQIFLVADRYSDFAITERYDAHFLTQALFSPSPLTGMSSAAIENEITVGLTDLILITRNLLNKSTPQYDQRQDFCYIGSTSAYAGFRDTSVYCAIKHGLLGFIRAMNDEYSSTAARFWLFSMGTMHTEMGARVTGQDPATYLNPRDVADRIVATLSSPTNIFEPEIIMRRRTIRFLQA